MMMKFLRRNKDLGIEGMSARWYNNNTRKHRLAEMKGYALEVTKHINEGSAVLEIAPGPGYLSIELAKLGTYKITGIDISNDFVEIARKNAKEEGVEVEFQQGNVADIHFPENTFNFIICTAAFKNFKEPIKALNEMYRVLKQGGTCLIIDMNRNVTDHELGLCIKNMEAKGIELIFLKLTFKYFLKKGAYTKDEFINLISKTEFNEHDIKEEGITLNVYLRK
jgi:ubiquinone/menaquinone biosynthesis C-methylase UbiE